jgi:hypothetical protein
MKVTYDSSNSGGDWWLTTEDWKKLEDAGWIVEWRKEPFLGAMADMASKEFDSIDDAKSEWEMVTGQDPDASGCDCCGPPHEFYC